MYQLTSHIEVSGDQKWALDWATRVEITRDTEKLTDECSITLPKAIKWDGETEIPVKRGDRVRVNLGYDGKNEIAFVGYVRDVSCNTPIVISCEDEMYKLKQMETKKKAYKNVNIETLLKEQGLKYTLKVCGEQRLGAYRVTADTVASLLGKLQEQGIRSFFRYENEKPVLYCGVLFERDEDVSQVFSTGLNIINYSNLKQQTADNMRIKINAVSLLPNNKKIKVEVGDSDGEKRTLHTYNKSETELTAWAKQELKRLKKDGLQGSLTSFGYKLVDKLDEIGIKIDGAKKGIYLVKKNVIVYGTDGYRQEITVGQKIAE